MPLCVPVALKIADLMQFCAPLCLRLLLRTVQGMSPLFVHCRIQHTEVPLKVSHPQQDGTGHEAHFTVARWGHDNSITAENPRNHAGGDEYWDF